MTCAKDHERQKIALDQVAPAHRASDGQVAHWSLSQSALLDVVIYGVALVDDVHSEALDARALMTSSPGMTSTIERITSMPGAPVESVTLQFRSMIRVLGMD